MPTSAPSGPDYRPLPNEEAIVSFNDKTLLTSESYLDVKAYEHALAFTVAGILDEDLLKDTRDAIKSALENGTDFATFKQRLKPFLMSKGWLTETLDDGTQQLTAGSDRRLRTIYHTNLHTSYAAGQWSRIQQTKEFLPYLQYMASVSEHPRLSHKRYYGICRPVDDSIWQSITPPNGYGCKCWVKQLTKRQAEQVGISPDQSLKTEKYINPKTGKTSEVPAGIEPSFNHNFDRLTALLKLAEDKHGQEFANKLKKGAEALLPEHLPSASIPPEVKKKPVKKPKNNPQSVATSAQEKEPDWKAVVNAWVPNDRLPQYEYAYKILNKKTFPLSKEEFFAVRYYTQDGYKKLNRYLRGELTVEAETQQLFDNAEKLINSALEQLPFYKESTVIRRINLTQEQLKEYNIGENVTFKALTSTTTNAKDVKVRGDENVRFVIHHKTGRDIRKLSQFESEGEVLLGSPTHYKVIKYTDLTVKKGYVEIELLEL